MSTQALIIFAKLPVAGQVKTRLGATIGMEEAATLYDEFARHAFALGAAMTEEGRRVRIFYEPAADEDSVQKWAGGTFVCQPQKGNTLGERMEHAFAGTFSEGADAVVIIGTDVPELSTQRLSEAFVALESHEVVIGPSSDGGYYLLGLRKIITSLFTDMAWSTDMVFQETVRRLQSLSIAYHLLPVLSDIDTMEDYMSYRERVGAKPA